MKCKTAVSIILALWCYPVLPQNIQVISPEEAVRTALSSNRDVAAARIRHTAAEKRVNQAWGDLMPTLESSASVSRQGAESGPMSLSDGAYDVRIFQAGLSINPGIFYNSLKLSAYEKAYAKEDLRKAEFQASSDAIKSYFNLIRASETVKMRKDSQSQLKSNYSDVQNLFKNGSVPRYELLQAEIQYKNSSPLLLESLNAEGAALDMLNLVLGAEINSYGASIDRVKIPVMKKTDDAKIISELTASAIKNRPEVIQLSIRDRQSRHSESLQQSLYLWPTFFMQGNIGYNRNLVKPQESSSNPMTSTIMDQIIPKIAGNDDWQKTWQIRAGATWRWNGFLPFDKTSQKEKEEALKTEEIALYSSQIRQSISISVRKNYLTLKTAYESIDVKRSTIATAEEGLRIARESYREGVMKNSDILNAEATLSSARASYIDSLYMFYSAFAELQRDTGSDCSRILFEGETQ